MVRFPALSEPLADGNVALRDAAERDKAEALARKVSMRAIAMGGTCTGAHGVGGVDIVENRLVGMKSRGVYETPGGTVLVDAHHHLQTITLDRETQHFKALVAPRYAELVYYGGDAADLLLLVTFFSQWYAAGGRQLESARRHVALAAARTTEMPR